MHGSVVVILALAGCSISTEDALQTAYDKGYQDAQKDLQAQLDTLQGQVDAVTESLDLTDIETYAAEIADLQARADIAEPAIQTLQAEMTTAQADITVNGTGLLAATALIGVNADDITDNIVGISANGGDISTLQGQMATALGDISTNAAALTAVPTLVDSSQIINVPGDFLTVQNAIASLDDTRIGAGGLVTINVGTGLHPQASSMIIEHPDAARIELVGDLVNPSSTVLQFGASDGVVVVGNTSLGLLAGFTIRGDNSTGGLVGLVASGGSHATVDSLEISGFKGGGVSAETNSSIASSNLSVTVLDCGSAFEAGSYGVRAASGSSTHLPGVSVSGCEDGGLATDGGILSVEDGLFTGNNMGVRSTFGGVAVVTDASATGNASHGFYAINAGTILGSNATSSTNGSTGFTANYMSTVQLFGLNHTGNFAANSPVGEGSNNSFGAE